MVVNPSVPFLAQCLSLTDFRLQRGRRKGATKKTKKKGWPSTLAVSSSVQHTCLTSHATTSGRPTQYPRARTCLSLRLNLSPSLPPSLPPPPSLSLSLSLFALSLSLLSLSLSLSDSLSSRSLSLSLSPSLSLSLSLSVSLSLALSPALSLSVSLSLALSPALSLSLSLSLGSVCVQRLNSAVHTFSSCPWNSRPVRFWEDRDWRARSTKSQQAAPARLHACFFGRCS